MYNANSCFDGQSKTSQFNYLQQTKLRLAIITATTGFFCLINLIATKQWADQTKAWPDRYEEIAFHVAGLRQLMTKLTKGLLPVTINC